MKEYIGWIRQNYTLFTFTFLIVFYSILIKINIHYFYILNVAILAIWWVDFVTVKALKFKDFIKKNMEQKDEF
jgi:hypothetical protein